MKTDTSEGALEESIEKFLTGGVTHPKSAEKTPRNGPP